MKTPTQQHVLVTHGLSRPFFLCPDDAEAYLVLVTPHQGYAQLEYTHDSHDRINQYPASVAWHSHDIGAIRTPYGDCLFGNPSAVRLRVFGSKPRIDLHLTPYKQEQERTYP